MAANQSNTIADPGALRTSVPRGEATVGLCKGALSGAGEESDASLRNVRLGQPLQRSPQASAAGGNVFPVSPPPPIPAPSTPRLGTEGTPRLGCLMLSLTLS